MKYLALALVVIVTWRVEWTEIRPCAPMIDPWTGEPVANQYPATCTERRFKWMTRRFDTRVEADAFIKTKPDNVTNLRVMEYVEPERKDRRGAGHGRASK